MYIRNLAETLRSEDPGLTRSEMVKKIREHVHMELARQGVSAADLMDEILSEILPSYLTYRDSQTRQLPSAHTQGSNPRPGPQRGPSRSQMVAAHWTRRKLVPVRLATGITKPLGACTREEVLSVADYLDAYADSVYAKASYYRALSEHLHDGMTVSDLPHDPVLTQGA